MRILFHAYFAKGQPVQICSRYHVLTYADAHIHSHKKRETYPSIHQPCAFKAFNQLTSLTWGSLWSLEQTRNLQPVTPQIGAATE